MANSVSIIGAGMAGLLAANIIKRYEPVIFERQPEIPNNHSAVLRFRSSIVSDVTGIPFHAVNMIKASLPWRNAIADALAYSYKNGGVMRSDRSIIAGYESVTRYIAPDDFIAQLANRVDQCHFNFSVDAPSLDKPIISTIPMPNLMDMLQYPLRDKFNFRHTQGSNITAKVQDCNAYVSLLVPDPGYAFSRISLTGNHLIVEGKDLIVDDLHLAAQLLGISASKISDVDLHDQHYAKIEPIEDDDARREFIFWASSEHNIFSLGRYACWKPKLLLDDLVQDIRLIEKWMMKRDRYAMKRKM